MESLEYFIKKGFLTKDNFIDLVTKTEFSDLVRRGSIEVFDLLVQKKLFDKKNDWLKLVKNQNFIRLLNDGHNAECFRFFIDNNLLTTNNFVEVVTDSNFSTLITYMNDSNECNEKRLTVLRLLVEGKPLLTADNLRGLIEENYLRLFLTQYGNKEVVGKIRNYSGGIKKWLEYKNEEIEELDL